MSGTELSLRRKFLADKNPNSRGRGPITLAMVWLRAARRRRESTSSVGTARTLSCLSARKISFRRNDESAI